MIALGRVGPLSAWQSFWFQDIPPHIYALLRIALGIVGLIGIILLTPVNAFWPVSGIVPEPGGGAGLRLLLDANGLGDAFGYALLAALLLSFISMTLGYRTSVAVAASWILTVVHARWNPLPLAGSYRVLTCLLFPLLWADSGQKWSIDARIRARHDSTPLLAVPIWPLRLIQFQIALIYLNSGLSKLLIDQWRDGTAVYYALSSNLVQRFPGPVPASFAEVLTVATYLTLVWEITFGVLLLRPWSRRLALGVGIALHAGMGLVLELGTFSLVMLASYLAFLDPVRVAAVDERSRSNSQRDPQPL